MKKKRRVLILVVVLLLVCIGILLIGEIPLHPLREGVEKAPL